MVLQVQQDPVGGEEGGEVEEDQRRVGQCVLQRAHRTEVRVKDQQFEGHQGREHLYPH